MNNRYLYRAKRTDNGEWIIGSLVQANHSGSVTSWIFSERKNSKERSREMSSNQAEWGVFEVRTDTICQCTGLEDKNGKLIWENDIVSGKMYLDYGKRGGCFDDKRIIKWDDDYARFIPCSYMKLDKYEVIGNNLDDLDCWRRKKEEQEAIKEVKGTVTGDMCEWKFVRDKWEVNNEQKIYRCPHNGKDYVRKIDKVQYCKYCGKRIKVV